MGEVYRSRDSKLGREVALKVLPSGVAADPDRLGRFSREAKLLAALNHPNIAAIYGLEDSSATNSKEAEPPFKTSPLWSSTGSPKSVAWSTPANPPPRNRIQTANPFRLSTD